MFGDIEAEKHASAKKFAKDFSGFLKRNKFCKKSYSVVAGVGNTIHVKSEGNDFYLRFKPENGWYENSIVIARIEFSQQRVGHGLKFLRFLLEHSEKYAIENIFIEYANEKCGLFAKKYGFSSFEKDHWFVTVDFLKSRLNDLT